MAEALEIEEYHSPTAQAEAAEAGTKLSVKETTVVELLAVDGEASE